MASESDESSGDCSSVLLAEKLNLSPLYMRLAAADFDETFAAKEKNQDYTPAKAGCTPPTCFVASHAPVSKAGVYGQFLQ